MNRRGFTLIEVIIAMTILVVVVLAMAAAAGQFVRLTAGSEAETVASQLAQERLQMIQMDPNYAALIATYEGTETAIPDATGFQRRTEMTRIVGGADNVDITRITVTVAGPGVRAPVVLSTTVAAP